MCAWVHVCMGDWVTTPGSSFEFERPWQCLGEKAREGGEKSFSWSLELVQAERQTLDVQILLVHRFKLLMVPAQKLDTISDKYTMSDL